MKCNYLGQLNPDLKCNFPNNIIAFGRYNLNTVGVLGDGSCFLHAIVYCINERYRNLDGQARRVFITNVRRDLAALFTADIYNSLGDGTIAELGKVDPNYNYTNLRKDLLNYTYWFGLEFLEFVSNTLDINIEILWHRNNTLKAYKYAGNNKIIHVKDRHTIVLYWQGNKHYQPVGRFDNGKNSFIFLDNDPMILELRKTYYYIDDLAYY